LIALLLTTKTRNKTLHTSETQKTNRKTCHC